jgi:hypothetical protein
VWRSGSSTRALFEGLFDGQSDEVRFAEATGFVSTLERLYEAEVVAAAAGDPDESLDAVAGGGPAEDVHVQAVVAAADEAGDVPTAPQGLPEITDIRRMFSELHIEPRADGGVRIDASPRAAQTLGALFSGMASLLERAAAGPEARP